MAHTLKRVYLALTSDFYLIFSGNPFDKRSSGDPGLEYLALDLQKEQNSFFLYMYNVHTYMIYII